MKRFISVAALTIAVLISTAHASQEATVLTRLARRSELSVPVKQLQVRQDPSTDTTQVEKSASSSAKSKKKSKGSNKKDKDNSSDDNSDSSAGGSKDNKGGKGKKGKKGGSTGSGSNDQSLHDFCMNAAVAFNGGVSAYRRRRAASTLTPSSPAHRRRRAAYTLTTPFKVNWYVFTNPKWASLDEESAEKAIMDSCFDFLDKNYPSYNPDKGPKFASGKPVYQEYSGGGRIPTSTLFASGCEAFKLSTDKWYSKLPPTESAKFQIWPPGKKPGDITNEWIKASGGTPHDDGGICDDVYKNEH